MRGEDIQQRRIGEEDRRALISFVTASSSSKCGRVRIFRTTEHPLHGGGFSHGHMQATGAVERESSPCRTLHRGHLVAPDTARDGRQPINYGRTPLLRYLSFGSRMSLKGRYHDNQLVHTLPLNLPRMVKCGPTTPSMPTCETYAHHINHDRNPT